MRYSSVKVSQINESSHENESNTALLTFVDIMHIIEKKKVLALLIRQIEETCTFSLLTLFRFVDDVRRLRLLER